MLMIFAKKFGNDRRGVIGILFGLFLVPVIAFVGAAVDYGLAFSAKTRLQAVTDIAAQAGARLPATANANRKDAALKSFNANMIGARFVAPEPQIQASNSGVTVIATTAVPTAFMGLIGINTINVNASAKARSQIQNGGVACLVALNENSPDGLHMQGINKMSSPDCWTWVNSKAATSINAVGAASSVAQGFCTAGEISGREHFSPPPFAGCDLIDDPFKKQINDQWVRTLCRPAFTAATLSSSRTLTSRWHLVSMSFVTVTCKFRLAPLWLAMA